MVPIVTPFPDIPEHVVQAKPVCLLCADWVCPTTVIQNALAEIRFVILLDGGRIYIPVSRVVPVP
jgi:hypothetical protein